MSPFQALYGYSPSRIGIQLNDISTASVEDWFNNREHILRQCKVNFEVAQVRMKQYADKNRTDREFVVGDWVYLKLQPYRQTSIALRKKLKLCAKFYGPYKVLSRVGKVAYRLDLLVGAKIHPEFHISQLKKKIGNNVVPLIEPLVTTGSWKIEVAPY